MRQAGHDRHGHRLTALIVVLWRGGLRIHEALPVTETDLDPRRGSILVRHGKVIAGARSAWTPGRGPRSSHGQPTVRGCPSGRCSACSTARPRGRAWSDNAARVELRHLALKAGVRRRFAPPPAQARARRRAHARRDPTAADPAPTGPLAPVNDRHLPRGDQHRRDHLDRPRPARDPVRAPCHPPDALGAASPRMGAGEVVG